MRLQCLLTTLVLAAATAAAHPPTMLTREQAGQILMQLLQVGQYPTDTVIGLSSSDLPAGFEVLEFDWETLRQLAPEDKDYPTMTTISRATWFDINTPYEHAYYFGVRFQPLNAEVLVTVNAWTGYVDLHPSPRSLEPFTTNSQMGLGNLPVLTQEQQQERALQIARACLGDGDLLVRAVFPLEDGTEVPYGEWGTAFLIYKLDPRTAAVLPQVAWLIINSRTGFLEEAFVYNRPLRVSTVPRINFLQAMAIANNYMNEMGIQVVEWVTHYPGDEYYRQLGMPLYFDFGLFVVEDGLLEQHLVWMLPCVWEWQGQLRGSLVGVNAHTGEVMTSVPASLVLYERRQRKNWEQHREVEVFGLQLNGAPAYLWFSPMRLVANRLYIQSRFARSFGVDYQDGRLSGKMGVHRLNPWERLHRNGIEYIPLRDVCKVAGIRLHWDNQRKVPILHAEWLDVKRRL